MASRPSGGRGGSGSAAQGSASSDGVTLGEEVVLFSAPGPMGHIAVTQCLVTGYGPKVR